MAKFYSSDHPFSPKYNGKVAQQIMKDARRTIAVNASKSRETREANGVFGANGTMPFNGNPVTSVPREKLHVYTEVQRTGNAAKQREKKKQGASK